MYLSKEKRYCINKVMEKAHLSKEQRSVIYKLFKQDNHPCSIPIGCCHSYTGCYAPFIIGQKVSNKVFIVQRRNQRFCMVKLNRTFYHFFKYHRL